MPQDGAQQEADVDADRDHLQLDLPHLHLQHRDSQQLSSRAGHHLSVLQQHQPDQEPRQRSTEVAHVAAGKIFELIAKKCLNFAKNI